MSRKPTRTGLALIAMLALGAVVASAANATTAITSEKFTASEYPVTLEGGVPSGVTEFQTEAGVVKCSSTFSATASAASTELTVTPNYIGCTAFGFIEISVNGNGCDYNFRLTTNGSFNGTSAFQAHVDIFECSSPTGIQIVAFTCELWVEPQNNLTTVDIHSMAGEGGAPSDVTIKPAVTSIAYEVTKDGPGCPFIGGPGTRSDGTYSSSSYVTLRGYAHKGSTCAQVGSIDVG